MRTYEDGGQEILTQDGWVKFGTEDTAESSYLFSTPSAMLVLDPSWLEVEFGDVFEAAMAQIVLLSLLQNAAGLAKQYGTFPEAETPAFVDKYDCGFFEGVKP